MTQIEEENQESFIDSETMESLEEGLTQEEVSTFEDAFRNNVMRCKELISSDQDKYYQCIAEIHTLLMMFEASMRSMMMNGGPRSIIKMLMGRK